jgi:hypothetical protein
MIAIVTKCAEAAFASAYPGDVPDALSVAAGVAMDWFMSRQLTRASRDNHILAEAFATFVHTWYAYTPELPDEAKGRAQRQAARRFEVFVQRVADRLGNGRPFLDDLVRDDLFSGEDLGQARKQVFAATSGNATDELISTNIEDEDIEPEDEPDFKASE